MDLDPSGNDTGAAAWHEALADLIDGLENEHFPALFTDCLRRLLPFDLAAIFIYRGRSRPLALYDDFHLAGAAGGIAAYVESSYVLNPFYRAYLKGITPGVYRIRDLAPDAFFESEYNNAYRVLPRATEEIGYLTENWPEGMEEALVVFALDGGEVGELGIYRNLAVGGFSDGDLARIAAVEPVLGAIFRKYWAGAARSKSTPPDSRVDDALARFGEDILTVRECEVARMILHGHSSESICFNLDISLGTVKTHRKNAYAKLGITSQSELLSLFLHSLQAL